MYGCVLWLPNYYKRVIKMKVKIFNITELADRLLFKMEADKVELIDKAIAKCDDMLEENEAKRQCVSKPWLLEAWKRKHRKDRK
jgi:hypothetical protein